MDAIKRAVLVYDKNLVLREKQREALLYLAERKGDLIVSLPVGYGKSVIFHVLPQLIGREKNNPVVVVVSPLNVIQKDQCQVLREHNISCCRIDIKANVEAHGIDDDENDYLSDEETYTCQCEVSLDVVKSGKFQIVICHPEALLNTRKGRQLLRSEDFQQRVVAVVIDECHIVEKWGEEFRTAFKELKTLKAFFPDVPVLGLSGTLTVKQKQELPKQLGLTDFSIIESSPDKPNLFLEKFKKETTSDVEGEYESVTHKLCDQLFAERERFPVTLLFIPVSYMSKTLMYLHSLFKPKNIDEAIYSAVCSGQDQYIIDKTVDELKKENPHIRLILTTSILGMGFDPKSVTNIVHACPPRNISQYFQEIGRAGRRGQAAKATLHYSARNIAKNLPGINEDIISYCSNDTSCLRNKLLSVFGYEKDKGIEGCKCCSFCKRKCTCGDCLFLNIEL